MIRYIIFCILISYIYCQQVLELALVVDDSASINETQWDQQVDAYKVALVDPTVLPQDGTVALGIWAFSSVPKVIHEVIQVSSASDAQSLADAFDTYTRSNGSTDTALAIQQVANALLTNNMVSIKQVIDISTDGEPNNVEAANTAADTAISNGIDQINCLGIELPVSDICTWIRGPSAFAKQASTFDDLGEVLKEKIRKEVSENKCKNGGTLSICNGQPCCKCTGGWTGSQCQNCTVTCENGGILNEGACGCDCVAPYAGDRCENLCKNIWNQYNYEPEEWQATPIEPSLDPLAGNGIQLNAAFGSRKSETILSPDGTSLYVGGGYKEATKFGYLTVFKRYNDGTIKVLQQFNAQNFGFTSISVGRIAVSADSKFVYAIIYSHDHTPILPFLVVFSRNSDNGGTLTYVEKHALSSLLTTHLESQGAYANIHLKISPDNLNIYVSGQNNDTNSLHPIVYSFRLQRQIVSTTTQSCEDLIEKQAGRIVVNFESLRFPCPDGTVCYNDKCTTMSSTGALDGPQIITGFGGFRVSDLLTSSESRFLYIASEGFATSDIINNNGLSLRKNSISVLERDPDTQSLSLIQTVEYEASSVRKSIRIFMEPLERLLYQITDYPESINGNRSIEVRSRGHLDGKLSKVPLRLEDLGGCDFDISLYHPTGICVTDRYLFIQSKIAGEIPFGSSVNTLSPLYSMKNTSVEVFNWANGEVCPTTPKSITSLLRFTYGTIDNTGQSDAYGMACLEDQVYMISNGSALIYHIAPRQLRYFYGEEIDEFVFKRNIEAVPSEPIWKGGSIDRFTIDPPLPTGLYLDEITGQLWGLPTEWSEASQYTVTGHNRRNFTAEKIITVAVVEGKDYQCPPALINNSTASRFGFGVALDDPFWWLWWLLLLLLLLLCCGILKQMRANKGLEEREKFMKMQHQTTEIEEVYEEYETSESEEEPISEDEPELIIEPEKPKPSPFQLRLKPTADRDIFLFGTRRIQLSIINDRLMVRVGGGWMPGEEFVEKNAPIEARKLGVSEDSLVELTRVGEDLRKAEATLKKSQKKAKRGW